MISKRTILLLMAGMPLLLASCHSNYLFISYDIFSGARWNEDHTRIAFIATTKAYRKAKGISAFPDGGTPEYLRNDTGLYLFQPTTGRLDKLVGFNDLTSVMKNRWIAELAFKGKEIHYRIIPTTEWHFYVKNARSPEKTALINSVKEKYSTAHAVNITNKHRAKIKSAGISETIISPKNTGKISLTKLNKMISSLPVNQWGLELQKIYPKSDRQYIDDFIYIAKGGCALTKRAITEQIISGKSSDEIREIQRLMDKHKNSLKGLEKTEYELYSKEAYTLIQSLL